MIVVVYYVCGCCIMLHISVRKHLSISECTILSAMPFFSSIAVVVNARFIDEYRIESSRERSHCLQLLHCAYRLYMYRILCTMFDVHCRCQCVMRLVLMLIKSKQNSS